VSKLSNETIARIRKAAETTRHAYFRDEGAPTPFDIIPCNQIIAVLDLLDTQTKIAGTLAQQESTDSMERSLSMENDLKDQLDRIEGNLDWLRWRMRLAEAGKRRPE